MDPKECWRQYRLAEQRVDKSLRAGDRAALAIAESQAAHWFAEWLAADALAARTSSTATATA